MPSCCICGGRDYERDVTQQVKLHRFPYGGRNREMQALTKKRQEEWLVAIARKDIDPSRYKNLRVCNRHFISGKSARIKDKENRDWVPTLFLGERENVGTCHNVAESSVNVSVIEIKSESALSTNKTPKTSTTPSDESSLRFDTIKTIRPYENPDEGLRIHSKNACFLRRRAAVLSKTFSHPNLKIKNALPSPTEKTNTEMNLELSDEKSHTENYIDDLVIEIVDGEAGNVKNEEEKLSVVENVNFNEMEERTIQELADKMISMEHFSLNKFMKFLGSDSDLYSFTGLQSFDLLNRIVSCVQGMKCAANIIESLTMPTELAIVMVFAKLKTNLTFKQLAFVFRLHPVTVSDTFSKFVPILRVAFEIAKFWPTKEEDALSIPNYVTSNFVNCRATCGCFPMYCDCSEMEIQKLQKLTTEINGSLCFPEEPRSTEKHILKFQLTMNRLGLITHVRSVYGEKVSEKYKFLTEGLLEKLEEKNSARIANDVVIVKEESSEEFSLVMKSILNHPSGVHIERSKQRIRSFKVFQDKVGARLLQHIDDIIVIVCSIVNLSSLLLDDSII